MKRYRLLKDLPTFNAGDEFELRDNGCLYLVNDKAGWHWKDDVMAYHKNTLARFPVLEEWFEEIKPPRLKEILEDLKQLATELEELLNETKK